MLPVLEQKSNSPREELDEEKSHNKNKVIEKEFQLNEKHNYWLQQINRNFKGKIDLSNQVTPFILERIVSSLVHRKREKEIFTQINNYFHLYKQVDFANILDTQLENEEIMMNAWPMYAYGFDKYGHPVLYDEVMSDSKNIKQIRNVFGNNLTLLKKYRHRFNHRVANYKQIQSKRLNKTIFKHIAIVDCSKFSLSKHLSKDIRNMLQSVINEEEILFPQVIYKLYLINTPKSFRVAWKIVSAFIDKEVQRKTKILGKDYLKELLKEIDIDQIPQKYGGDGKENIKLGHSAQLN